MSQNANLFEVRRNANVGRYATAKCDIKAGTIIFTEVPFAFGPKEDTVLVCLGCCAPTNGENRCTKCDWPVCGIECESQPVHRDAECPIFAKARVKFYPLADLASTCLQYECITPLRVLLAKTTNPQRWHAEIECMENHNEERKGSPIWNFNQINIVNYLRGPCKMTEFTADDIHTVCGILECNAFEANTLHGHPIRCLYPKLAILSHSCLPNTSHTVDPRRTNAGDVFSVSVIATVDVKSQEELYATYTNLLWPTLIRRDHLRKTKYFECNCERCSDPLELNTHFSSLRCKKCTLGFVTSLNPLDSESKWKCNLCGLLVSGESIEMLFRLIQNDLNVIQKDQNEDHVNVLEDTLTKYNKLLHTKNAYNIQLQLVLCQFYGRLPNYRLKDLPDILLERKVALCKDVLEVIDILRPGLTRIRATILYELYSAMYHFAEMLYSAKYITEKDLKHRLDGVIVLINEAKTILAIEPPVSYEGKLKELMNEDLLALNAKYNIVS